MCRTPSPGQVQSMKIRNIRTRALIIGIVALVQCGYARAQESGTAGGARADLTAFTEPGGESARATLQSGRDTIPPRKTIHRFGVEVRPAYIISSRLPRDGYRVWGPSGSAFSTHLKYSFKFHPNTVAGYTYPGAYQGLGVAWNDFRESTCLGSPMDFYLFQGAHIARISPQFSVNYEWNFGLSTPWKPYDQYNNPENYVIGSKVNAYLNFNFYLNWQPLPQLAVSAGVDLTHFSNGNTKYPNAGLNTVGAKIGLTYNFNRDGSIPPRSVRLARIEEFPRHVSYDLVFFGSWRRRGIIIDQQTVMLPDAYTVVGFSFSPMYNFGHNFRAGAALDGFYDSSANLRYGDCISEMGSYCEPDVVKPAANKQIALGLSARVEFVMPYFTIGLGLGTNVIHGGGDMKSIYQILSLKVEVIRNSFIHIGYSLHNFHDPNFLMLGVGFRFNNKSPDPYR